MTFTMNLSQQAKKEMAKLDRPLARRLRDRLRELAENPLDSRLSRQMKTARTDVILAWGIGAFSFK